MKDRTPPESGERRSSGVVLTRFVQSQWADTDEYREVAGIAEALKNHGNTSAMQTAIALAHGPRSPSSLVQAAFLQFATDLGFRNEARGLFADYQMRLRPDYFRALGSTGILLEFERGKTITNNMDLLDFWKCHLCASAHYLFLLVPQDLRHGETGFAERPYSAVIRRFGPFFEARNHTNVRAAFVFGY
jgi:hypothetical protein